MTRFATAASETAAAPPLTGFARDVRQGLGREGQKAIPSKYLYDDLGSALFDAITHLPEYGVTRADERVLRRAAPELTRYLPGELAVAELGSGSGGKTRIVLEALAYGRQPEYHPIDVSAHALARCERALEDVVAVRAIHAGYLEGMERLERLRTPGCRLLLLFLGSNIGNFDRRGGAEFLRRLRRRLRPGDATLIGMDLEKPEDTLLAAYDDPSGVTAAFNRNLLGRINRELGGNFDLRSFAHEARYHRPLRRVEMHLRATRDQDVEISDAEMNIRLRRGETIWTESSYKYVAAELPLMAAAAGFLSAAQWVDEEWPFAENLWVAA